jgi:N-acetylglucosaminyldiphosphoundecaprenol N-acetyl-beta-D-mannosaminyltransferase
MKNNYNNKERFKIGCAYISNTNLNDAINKIEKAITERNNKYICVSNMRMVRYANKKANKSYLKIMNNSFMNLPDGAPLVWCGRLWGLKKIRTTSGPKLFQTMLREKENGLKHFLLGDTNDTLEKITIEYGLNNNSNIVGTFSPPFVDISEYNYNEIAEIINKSDADIVWVSMRAPKQDIFSYKILPLLNNKVCISVGRAFRIAIGEVKDAPDKIKKIGLSGIFTRRVSLLRALWWYFITFFYLSYYMIQIIYRRLFDKAYN